MHNYLLKTDLIIEVRILINSRQSSIKLINSFSLIYPVSYRSSNQYSDSLASLSEIFILAPKSDVDCPRIASFTFAPILVPLLSNCFYNMYSCLFSTKY